MKTTPHLDAKGRAKGSHFLAFDSKEALLGMTTRLRNIVRYSIYPRSHDESVAEHLFYTTFYTLLLCEENPVANKEIALARALIHDVDECFSGDFIRMFKYSSPELKKIINDTCSNLVVEMFRRLYRPFPESGKHMSQLWKRAKCDDLEGLIVSFADFMSVASYLLQELRSGNFGVFECLTDLQEYFKVFKHDKYAELWPRIKAVGVTIAAETKGEFHI